MLSFKDRLYAAASIMAGLPFVRGNVRLSRVEHQKYCIQYINGPVVPKKPVFSRKLDDALDAFEQFMALDQPNKKLWMRLGVNITITATEEKELFGTNETRAAATLQRIISEGRFEVNGHSYIPEQAIADYNQEYGTAYQEEIEINL